MDAFLARQAILDDKAQLHAYELLFRDGQSNSFPLDMCPDQATSKLLTQNHLATGFEEVTGDKKAFINFSEETLIHRFPNSIDPDTVVIEILEDVVISHALLKTVRQLHKAGFTIALDDHDFDPKWDIFLPYVNIIKVDVLQFNILQIAKYVRRISGFGITLLAEKVETREQFDQLKTLGFSLFQGYFFAKPEVLKKKTLSANQVNLLELICMSSRAELDLAAVNSIIEKDVALSYQLLRFINSSSFTKDAQIGDLKHALNYMGEAELKKFISLIALANLNEEKPSELLGLSVSRAHFCQKVADLRGDYQDPPSTFLTGMFSLVDALLDEEMASLMTKLPLLDEIKQALQNGEGTLGQYIKLARLFERGQWQAVEDLANTLNVDLDKLSEIYNQALSHTDLLLAQHKSRAKN
ncbi:EAL domain-containing protein [Catenovulum sp. SM1970]|uniref:EAL and HDOD domain-containing protein n=1 Tax=Marinifaba aquimaris TaxID=2741323 RepID=UPI001573082C|nr:EAL domain-containing protein [Marinifaba aquimaris]NTS76622.1 EAL domain-containing protein [Marinifaba aquimaris]